MTDTDWRVASWRFLGDPAVPSGAPTRALVIGGRRREA